jgi:3'-phosphoadenosine 5'-phosphosulfate sulfotransferase (PAPS reductase)/FAD synthetase
MGRIALDLQSAYSGQEDAEREAFAILDAAYAEHAPVAVYGLLSGGHDSLNSCHLLSRRPYFSGAVHINTGIGIEETRQYARDLCRRYGWPLQELRPPLFIPVHKCRGPKGCYGRNPACQKCGGSGIIDKRRPGISYQTLPAYEAMVLHFGFPGPAGHGLMYQRLKQRCLEHLIRTTKRAKSDRVMLVTGCRASESTRRMGTTEKVQRQGATVWVAPLLNWSTQDKEEYQARHKLPTNQVAKRLCMSGECLCGAFAKPGELAEIAAVSPKTAAYIRGLQRRAAEADAPNCKWGQRPGGEQSRRRKKRANGTPLFNLCWTCEANQEAEQQAS